MALLDSRETEPRITAASDRESGTLLGIRTSAVVEVLIFLSGMLVADYLFLDGHRFQDMEPHPFWIIVLLISVQYGSLAGLFSVAAASAALLIGEVPSQEFGEDLYAHIAEMSRLPIMWAATAVILGELQGRRIRREQQLRQSLLASEERELVLAEGFQNLKQRTESLEELVAGQSHTFFTTYKAAKAIEKRGVGQVLLGIPGLLHEVLGPCKFSLFLLNGDKLEAAICEGWKADDALPTFYTQHSPIFEAIVVRRQHLCVVKGDDERVLGGDGVLAGPLVSLDSGAVIGMLKCEEIGFLGLNVRSIENFRLLCDWIGTAYANARQTEELQLRSMLRG